MRWQNAAGSGGVMESGGIEGGTNLPGVSTCGLPRGARQTFGMHPHRSSTVFCDLSVRYRNERSDQRLKLGLERHTQCVRQGLCAKMLHHAGAMHLDSAGAKIERHG